MLLGAIGFDQLPDATVLDNEFTRGETTLGWMNVQAGTGRSGGRSLNWGLAFDLTSGWLRKTLATELNEVWACGAFQRTTGTNCGLLQFLNASLQPLVTIIRNSSGQVEARRGGPAGPVIGTSVGTMGSGVFVSIAAQVLFHSTVGTLKLRVASTVELDLTNVDTAGATGDAKYVLFGSTVSGSGRMDDLVWGDVTGALNNSMPVDLRVTVSVPTADTAQKQFTPNAGPTNYTQVDELPANGDTDYVESTTSGHTDRYTHSGSYAGLGIRAAIVRTVARGGSSMRHVIRSSATDAESPANITTEASAYRTQSTVFETDPATGLGWGTTALAAAEFGMKVA